MINVKNEQNTIWVCGNRNQYMIQYNPCYILFDPFGEADGENINSLNKFWSEFVCQYYARKNNLKSQVVTFCHDTRLIKAPSVNCSQILANNSIEYYYTYYTNMRNTRDNMGNIIGLDKISQPNLKFRNFYYEIVIKMGQPEFMYDLFTNYLKRQNIVSMESIDQSANEDDYIFITREIFSCAWETFLEMSDFTIGYFDYIQNELNLSYDLEKHKQFFINEIFPHYRKLNDNNGNRLSYSNCLYQSRDMFYKIYRPDLNYGFYDRNNVFRLFSYHIEILISIFIKSRPNFRATGGSLY